MTQTAKVFETMEYGEASENTDTAKAWIKQHKATFGHFIGGKFVTPAKTKWTETRNPATGEKLGKVSLATKTDVNNAVKAARKAQKSWAALDSFKRAKYLYAIARLIQKNSRLLAVLETLDVGKPINESKNVDIPAAARHFYHHAGWAQILDTEFEGYEAHGVVGQIIPWNFPFLMLAWKIAPALAAGNTVVLKPAELTPLTAVLFAEICQEAGLPAGVVNIVQGDGSTGSYIVNHKDINKIAFTGSTDVGRILRRDTAGTGKALTLELGGKSPNIIFDDADLNSAVEGIVNAIWFNQGEVCCAGSRLLVQEGIAEKLIRKLKLRIEKMRVGSPIDKSIDMGAIISKEQYNKIDKMVKQGVKEGAKIIQAHSYSCPNKKGFFYPPTILANVEPTSTVAQKEIFGPVLSVMTFRNPDEAVKLANNTPYGLGACLWSENINLALDIAPKIKSGVVWINAATMFDASCGFGGYKESGFGREGGREGMYAYLKPSFLKHLPKYKDEKKTKRSAAMRVSSEITDIDRTAKLYIGGKQKRPDGGYSLSIANNKGKLIGQVGEGNRKDIRNAVEAAKKAESSWSNSAHHLRAQILYYIAENLSVRANEFKKRIVLMTGVTPSVAKKEVDESIRRLFAYSAWADKFEGAVHNPPMRLIALAMKEAIGTVGVICPDEAPLLGMVSLFAPLMAMGNCSVIIPSEKYPLITTDFYQVLDTSDVPGGVVNIVTGHKDELTKTLSEHADVNALWYFGSDIKGSKDVQLASVDNLKQTWVNDGKMRDWFERKESEGKEFLSHSVQIKNIWVPYGE